jgi:hypothetical protein
MSRERVETISTPRDELDAFKREQAASGRSPEEIKANVATYISLRTSRAEAPEPQDDATMEARATAGRELQETQHSAAREMDRRAQAGQLSPRAMDAWSEIKRRKGIVTPAPAEPTGPAQFHADTATGDGNAALRTIGVGATGFNKGLGMFVDLVNEGFKAVGLPTSDEPFMGSAFIDKYLAGANFQPQSMFERVVQRAGLEVGANMPLLAGGMIARGAQVAQGGTASRAATDAAKQAGRHVGNLESTMTAVKAIPKVLVEQMAEQSPVKLAALETAMAGSAGVGAEAVHEVWPEGGPTAEFFGEVLTSFTPAVALNLVQKAHELAKGVVTLGRSAVGLESVDETKTRLGSKLSEAAKLEDVQAGVKRAGELKEEVPGLNLSAGEAITAGAVSDTQIAAEKGSVAIRSKARENRTKNIEAVKSYFDATAPPGNPTRLIEHLETQRSTEHGLLDVGLARSEAKLEAVRGNLSTRSANLLNDMEARMSAADQRVDARLRAIGSSLSPKERGEIIRAEYDAEVGAFRERSRADYHELDMLGHAELPVQQTMQKLLNLSLEFPEHIQIIRKMNPRVAAALDNMGHDYEMQLRATKAIDDMGIRDASGKGVRVFHETQGKGGTQDISGLSRGTPDWYRNLTLRKENPLTREQIDSRLFKLSKGLTLKGNETDEEILKALRGDREFSRSPYNEPVLQHLPSDVPSASLKDLRSVRADLLALSRQAKASDNRLQRYVINELISGVDNDIDQLLPGQSAFSDVYPEHGTLYRNVSADYRAGVHTLMKGTANRLRLTNRYGDYTTYDESIPALFFRNETTMQDFEKALGSRPQAVLALRDYAKEDFLRAAIHKKGDQFVLSQPAADAWMKEHAAHLKQFPELAKEFSNTAKLVDEASALHEQVAAFRDGKRGEQALLRRLEATRHPGDFTTADISKAQEGIKHAQELVERSQHDWEHSTAGLFLKENPNYAAQRLATSRDPIKDYDALYEKVKGEPDAVAGLKKAIWNALTDKIQPKLTGLSGDMNLGVFHKELQSWIYGHEQLMSKVLGPEGMQRIKTTSEVVEKVARGGRDRSDTAINLQVQAALASTWISRAFAIKSGRVGQMFGVSERVGTYLTKYFTGMTAKQQEGILLESFFDPKVYETLVLAGTRGPKDDVVKARTKVHLHLLNLSEQGADERK